MDRSRFLATLSAVATLLVGSCAQGSDSRSAAPKSSQATRPASTSATATTTTSLAPEAPLVWASCADAKLAGLECTTMRVPLDRARPAGTSTQLAIARHRARLADQRAGTVVLNVGGPGASGLTFLPDFVRGSAQGRPGASGLLLDRFDIVAYDPRGVGQSEPLDCHTDMPAAAAAPTNPAPTSPTEIAQAVAAAEALNEWCAQRAGARAGHLGTVEGAWDLERLSRALDDGRLNYLGLSYGSELGLTHAAYFPESGARYVFDGPLAPGLDDLARRQPQALGFERSFEAFVDWCARNSCPAGPDPRGAYTAAMTRATNAPLPGTANVSLGPAGLLSVTLGAMYSERQWDAYGRGLAKAAAGDGSTLAKLFEQQQSSAGTVSNEAEMQRVISCTDRAAVPTAQQVADLGRALSTQAPLFGRFVGWQDAACLGWSHLDPLPANRARPGIQALVVGTTGDPATPFDWARSLAADLRAPLVTRDANLHTAYSFSPCVQDVVDHFLLGDRTTADTTCD